MTTATRRPTTAAADLPEFPADSTMAKIQAKGKIVIGTKFNQLGSGLKNPTTGDLEGFDIEIGKLIAAEIFGVDKPRTPRSKIEFKETPDSGPRVLDSEQDRRHHHRDVHDQRRAEAGGRLRRAVRRSTDRR